MELSFSHNQSGGWDGMLSGPSPPPSVSTSLCVEPTCFSLKPNFFHCRANHGHQWLLNSKSDCFHHQEGKTYKCPLKPVSKIPRKDFCLAQIWKGVSLLTNQLRPES